ncbi:unnamed protein product, partial [Rotaria sp. Silwood1]
MNSSSWTTLIGESTYYTFAKVFTTNPNSRTRGSMSEYIFNSRLPNGLSSNIPNVRKREDWNVYFYDDLKNLNEVWKDYGLNKLSSGELWIEFLRYYTEIFDYDKNIVTIRQIQPLPRSEKGWFHPTIAIEDPFILTHDLTEKLSLRNWFHIHRVFLHARNRFGLQSYNDTIDINESNIEQLE